MSRTVDLDGEHGEEPARDVDHAAAVVATVSLPSTASTAPVDVPPGTAVGRYVVDEAVGAGGMGRVFRARDPDLARTVAIKLVHDSSPEGQARLFREAQTMAQLAHPNVVAVHDVGMFRDQVFLAMEFVDGWSMRSWLERAPRAVGEIVACYVAAGRGLAAAHGRGIVHRDFKPDNVIISRDGRVLVGDFGLALGAIAPAEHAQTGPNLVGVHMTRHGAVLGTPGYIAPELGAGQPADARADQYAFCASLFEAIVGAKPADASPEARARMPPWLLRIVERGLRDAPAERYPAMAPLLDALALDRGARRRRRIAAVALTLAFAGAGAAVWAARGDRATGRLATGQCRSARALVTGAWDAEVRGRVAAAFARSGAPYRDATLASTTRILDQYASDWIAMRVDSCEATMVRHEQDAQTHGLRLACLDQRLDELAALSHAAQDPDPRVVERLTQAAASLRPVAACADRAALRLATPLPADPSLRDDLAALSAAIGQARVAWTLGRYRDGRAVAKDAAAEAHRLGARSLEAEALAVLGYLAMGASDGPGAAAALEEGLWAAEAARRDDVAVEAAMRLAISIGYLQGRPNDVGPWLALAAAIEERMGAPSPVKAERLSVLGVLASRRGDFAHAVPLHREALQLATLSHGADSFVVAKFHANLGAALIELGQPADAIVELEASLAIGRAQQGATHPDVGMQLSNLAIAHARVGNTGRAIELLTEAATMREQLLGPNNPALVPTLNNLASVMLDEGRGAAALPYAQRAAALAARTFGPDHVATTIATITLGSAQAKTDAFADAEATLTRALAQARALAADPIPVAQALEAMAEMRERQRRPHDVVALASEAIAIRAKAQQPDAVDLAHPLELLGNAHAALGAPRLALAPLERAVAIRTASRTSPRTIADARGALAEAQRRAQREPR